MHSDTTYEVWGEHPDRVILSTESRAAVEYMAAQAFVAEDVETLKCRVFEVRHVNGWEPLPVQPLAAFVPPVMGPIVPQETPPFIPPQETPPCDPPQAAAPVPTPKRRARKSR